MDNKSSYRVKKIVYYIFSVFLVLTLIYTTFAVFIQVRINGIKQEEIIKNQEEIVATKSDFAIYKLNRLIGDVQYITDMFKIGYLNHSDYSEVISELLSFSNRIKIYDQIRYIGIDGYEKIRIDYAEDGSFLINGDQLQDKSDYYYFINTIKLNDKQIYFSRFDLNVENKVIEEPKKPVIRIATPLYINGESLGIIILNYYGNDMLEYINSGLTTIQSSVYMLNSDGYWIINSDDSNLEWGFLYTDKTNDTFTSYYPNEWNMIKQENEGTIVTENGVFSFANIYINGKFGLTDTDNLFNFEEKDYYVVAYLSPASTDWIYFNTNPFVLLTYIISNNIFNYGILLLVAIAIGVLFVVYKTESDKIRYFSTYDVMTGTYNRRAGLDKLNSIYKRIGNENKGTSVCFIDINGLKEVNDVLGHIMGDELIMNVVSVIKRNIRENDFISRFGGDEFLIVLVNVKSDDAEMIWKRISLEFEKINNEQDNPYNISASHGIHEMALNTDESIDTIINIADAKMYEEKRVLKENLTTIKKIK